MGTLTDAIRDTVAGWQVQTEEPLYLEQQIFGTSDPRQIARRVEAFCTSALGVPVEDGLFWSSSIGSVFGVLLADGRRVVVKAHPPAVSTAALAAVQRVQRFLTERHFPCPAPILGPVPFAAGHAMVEELIDAGSYADAHDPRIRRVMVRTLAELVTLTQPLGPMPDLRPWAVPAPTPGSLWPPPHSALFNFAATGAGAEWIDDLARAAQQALEADTSRFVIGHTDWSVKHFRFSDAVPTVIYDWDSLAYIRESKLVGIAGATFTMTWELPVRPAPRPEETEAFIAEYEEARGAGFSAAERRAVLAHVTYALAYGARCEHSLDPGATAFPSGSLREGLLLHRATLPDN